MATEPGRERFEALLMDVVVGDRPADDPEVLALAESDAAFRDELDEIRAMVGRVSAAAELERQVLADYRVAGELGEARESGESGDAAGSLPGEDQVESVLLGLIADTPAMEHPDFAAPEASTNAPTATDAQEDAPAPSGTLLRLLVPLAGAAAVLFVFLMSRSPDGDAPGRTGPSDPGGDPGGLILGAGGVVPLTPRGDVEDFGTFRWAYELEPGQRFEIRVLDPATGDDLLPAVQTEDKTWAPATAITDGWPDEIAWEVSLVSVLNEIERTSERVRVSRAPR